MEYSNFKIINKIAKDIEAIRGGDLFTTVYLKNEEVLYFKESFDLVNNEYEKINKL